MKRLVACLLVCMGAVGLNFTLTETPTVVHYDFDAPNSSLVLPALLHEISGLTIIDTTTIACIQDENGILFLYDIRNNKIKQQFTFGLNGDYEGITRVENTLYVLRSDGVLFELNNYLQGKLKVKTYGTGIPAANNEGLCYDSLNNRLLIGAKGKINKDAANKDKRFIYEFSLPGKTLQKEPVFSFNTALINSFAKNNGVMLPKKQTRNGKFPVTGFKLNTSEIGIHPVTKQLYVLSAIDHCLFIFNMYGAIEKVMPLNPVLFNKAEGLSFFANGDLLVSNEGQLNKPTLLRFNYK